METGMSQQELKRVEIIALRRSGQIDQAEAARRLGVTVRQVRRLEAKVARHGAVGLRSGRRGRPSNHRLAVATVAEAGRLIRAHYRDFGPTLAAEYLQERHGLALSKETVRQIMIAAKLWRPQRGAKAAIYALRERRPRFGELIQIDGSAHAWFEDRGPHCCLLVFIDDATSRLTQLRFVPQECTLGYMQTRAASPVPPPVPTNPACGRSCLRGLRTVSLVIGQPPRSFCSSFSDHQHPATATPPLVAVCTPVFVSLSVPQESLPWLFTGAACKVYSEAVGVTEKVMLYLMSVPLAPLGDTPDNKEAPT